MSAPRVFISYSRESPDHEAWVLELAASLRKNGVDASLDQWDLRPGHDLTFFMESHIRDSDFVILVCTPTFAEKSNIPRGGVGYEKNIISAELLQSQDLRPKFLPVLRAGDFSSALPRYLGSKYAIDLRPSRDQAEGLDDLLRAIHEVAPSSKLPLGANPYAEGTIPSSLVSPIESEHLQSGLIVDGHVESWEDRALGRFNFLRETRINTAKGDPFSRGYWQASFALQGRLRDVNLRDFLSLLTASETHRTGWDVGWVPTREGIAAYPYQDGIEVWLAEAGGTDPGHSDFWRAEKIGTFALFRGYQEDEGDFTRRFPEIKFDYSLVLWRISEFLLYIEKFAHNLGAAPVSANLSIRWNGLEDRTLGNNNAIFPMLQKDVCHQPSVQSTYRIPDTSLIMRTLVTDVQRITAPLFETFDFFVMTEDQVKSVIRKLFDVDRETGI